jgi:hypothetical protein
MGCSSSKQSNADAAPPKTLARGTFSTPRFTISNAFTSCDLVESLCTHHAFFTIIAGGGGGWGDEDEDLADMTNTKTASRSNREAGVETAYVPRTKLDE